MSNIVAIVGRPNVGKSTLFNRLVEERKAIMHDESGVTRDRHYGQSEWNGNFFTVIDTGGYVVGSEDVFEKAIREQVEIAMEEASVILFMVDTHVGVNPLDEEFVKVLRRSRKPIYLVANKVENFEHRTNATEFYNLGIGELYCVSSQTGTGTGDLLDDVVKNFEEIGDEDPNAGLPKIAILGRPNVGKSSFLNILLGEERTIVSDISGTTRDSIDTHYKAYGQEFILTDTAGMRRKARVKENIEFYSVMRSLKALDDCDVCIVMIDATQKLESQDLTLIRLAADRYKGIVLIANKWDLVEKDSKTAHEYTLEMQQSLGSAAWVPIIFTSMLTKQRVFQSIEKAIEVYEARKQKISTSKLNNILLPDIKRTPPPVHRGKNINIKYITQLQGNAPLFAFFTNYPQHVHESYKRFLENKIREHFGFEGVPIRIIFKEK
ncbi:ribosome-associated GTPase EngA [Bernardetia litoralis DSM 6794]|uniref:GTPase Der n=1 Tax=Bernardetia litoralis (strain ATCC 23117 / DSM 6794 / NBRC 15988 / NCIMB 1366 / Fx l1 / Sio-4) TaxID=880071 RepID=I4AKM9_BERLS|nr:ribosome biogenesis GTPase Der [Bernardetia litoralis]AFM04514.1 ribosome-associated GTPase EngA [Bernardetia litoralis DSM 6794]